MVSPRLRKVEPTDMCRLDWLDAIDPEIEAHLSPLERLVLSVLRQYARVKAKEEGSD